MNEAIGGGPSIHPTPWLSHQKNSSDSIPVENEQEMTEYDGGKGEILGLCEKKSKNTIFINLNYFQKKKKIIWN